MQKKNKRQKKLLEHSTTNFAGIFLSQKNFCYFIKMKFIKIFLYINIYYIVIYRKILVGKNFHIILTILYLLN